MILHKHSLLLFIINLKASFSLLSGTDIKIVFEALNITKVNTILYIVDLKSSPAIESSLKWNFPIVVLQNSSNSILIPNTRYLMQLAVTLPAYICSSEILLGDKSYIKMKSLLSLFNGLILFVHSTQNQNPCKSNELQPLSPKILRSPILKLLIFTQNSVAVIYSVGATSTSNKLILASSLLKSGWTIQTFHKHLYYNMDNALISAYMCRSL